jgi:hypothetical protein
VRVGRGRARRHSSIAAALVAILALAGCGGDAPVIQAAGLDEMLGPYRTEPFSALDPAAIQSMELGCREEDGGVQSLIAQPMTLVLADIRGAGRFTLLFTGPDGTTGECTGAIDANGTASVESSGGSLGGDSIKLGPLELGSSSGSAALGPGSESWSAVNGQIGSEIGGIVVELNDGTRVTASIAHGLYAAWWPGQAQQVRLHVYDRAGNLVMTQ